MFIKYYPKWVKSVSVLMFFLTLSGCGVWRNFTTYFNTYFNAKSIFETAEEEILKQKTDIFEFKETKISTQNNQSLTKVIEKCSKILQFDTESAYFPDALFLTGKAFYYQEEYSKAERKFMELDGQNNEQYNLINKYWLGKTKLQLREFDDGLALIKQVQTEAKLQEEDEIFNQANITEIGFLIYRENFDDAINIGKSFLEAVDDEEIKALVAYQIGKIYLLKEDFENAATYFGDVLNYSPSFQVEFDSKIEYARLLKKLNRLDESLAVLEELQDQDKFKNNHDQVFLELAYIYREKKDTSKAIGFLRDVDTTYKQKASAGYAQFELADIYQMEGADYDSSLKYYNKAAGSLIPRDLKLEAGSRARDLTRYFSLKNIVSGFEISLGYLQNPEKFVQDSIDYEITYRKVLEELQTLNPNLAAQQTQTAGQQTDPATAQTPEPAASLELSALVGPTTKLKDKELQNQIIKGKIKKPQRPKLSADSIKVQIAKNYYDLGGLFFSELEVPDSAVYYYDKILNDSLSQKYMVKTQYALGTVFESIDQKEKGDSLFNKIYSENPDDPLAAEAGKKLGLVANEGKVSDEGKNDPALNLFLGAEKKYFSKEFKEAVEDYKQITEKYPESVFAPKSLLAAGMIYEENLKMYDSAAVIYDVITKKFDKSNYAKVVAAKLDAYNKEKERIKNEEQKKLDEQKSKAKADSLKLNAQKSDGNPVLTDALKPAAADSLKNSVDSLRSEEFKHGIIQPKTAAKDSAKKTDDAKLKSVPDAEKRDSVKTDSILNRKNVLPGNSRKTKVDTSKTKIEY